jgi:hypothetical protein
MNEANGQSNSIDEMIDIEEPLNKDSIKELQKAMFDGGIMAKIVGLGYSGLLRSDLVIPRLVKIGIPEGVAKNLSEFAGNCIDLEFNKGMSTSGFKTEFFKIYRDEVEDILQGNFVDINKPKKELDALFKKWSNDSSIQEIRSSIRDIKSKIKNIDKSNPEYTKIIEELQSIK